MRPRPARAALALALGLGLAAGGCASRSGPLYHWGRYDESLYRQYKNPQDRVAFVQTLEVVIATADQRGLKVPPGICAEYGFALYEEGRLAEATRWFQRERDEWPESRILMEKMVRNTQLRAGQAPVPAAASTSPAAADLPAGAPERTP